MNIEENKKLWAKIVAKAWADEAYKKQLIANPKEVLTKEGAEIPQGFNIHVVETPKKSEGKEIYLYLPKAGEDIAVNSDEQKLAADTIKCAGASSCG